MVRNRSGAKQGGFTLVEVMVSFGIFAFTAIAVVAGIIQTHKISESNLAQGYAYSTAQSLIEEIIRVPPAMLSDPNQAAVTIKLAKLTTDNYTSIDDFTIPWSADATTFTEIGTTSAGVLTDAAYIADSKTVRPERFMRMRVNLQRQIEEVENRVRITMRYQWAIPDRNNTDGSPIFLSGEIRTVRSTALRF